MDSKIAWSPALKVGIDIIDAQHKQLFQHFQDIEQCLEQQDAAKAKELCYVLVNYAVFHNSFEESMMDNAGYPIHKAHHQVHETFKLRAYAYLEKLDKGAEPLLIAQTLHSQFGPWFIKHIQSEDKHYAPYVKRNRIRAFISRQLAKLF